MAPWSPRHNWFPFAIFALIRFVSAIIGLFPLIHLIVVVGIINYNHIDKHCVANALCDFDEKCSAIIRSGYIFIAVLVELINLDSSAFELAAAKAMVGIAVPWPIKLKADSRLLYSIDAETTQDL